MSGCVSVCVCVCVSVYVCACEREVGVNHSPEEGRLLGMKSHVVPGVGCTEP